MAVSEVGATRIRVRTSSQDVYLATVVRSDTEMDLALLRVSGYSGAFLPVAEDDQAGVGTDVIAVGSPLGLEGTVTRGIISARRTLGGVPLVQIDAAINPGNSGGPLLAEDGTVIGVNTWKLRPQGAESLGFAVAASAVRRLITPYLR
jgi:serine protease Do